MKKKVYKHTLVLPQKLLSWLKDIQCSPPDIIGFEIERMEYILSTIIKHKQDKHPGAYSVLNMEYLRGIVPYAGKYIQYLRDNKIIEYKNYLAGRNSRLYRIKKQYDGNIVFRTVTDNRLNRKIGAVRMQIKNRNSKKYPKLNEYVYSVSIDYDAALFTIDKRYKYSITENADHAEARRAYSLAEVSKIAAGEIFISVNNTNGRYDTNFTHLPSELMPHLSIDGQPLTEIDIVNSQPFFAVSLFNPTPGIESIITGYLGKKYTMYIKSLQLSQYEDVKLYAALVQSGTFYEYMMQKFDLNGIEYRDRRAAKELIFTVFFSKNSAVNYSGSLKLFRSLFPNVYRLFEAIKENEHNRLAILLQRIEAYVILDNVAQRIVKELPGVKFITKHDSLLPAGFMVADNVSGVSKILEEVVENLVGVKPTLKLKKAFTKKKVNKSIHKSIYP